MKKKSIPNILSAIRLLMTPLFILLFFKEYPDNTIPALVVFVLASATDVLDGYIARKYNFITNLGKILDPLADKLMQASAFICLSVKELIPAWMVIGYFLKEILMAIGATLIFKRQKIVVKSSWYGKSATVLIFASIIIFMLFGEVISPALTDTICFFLLGYIIFAFVMYYLTAFKGKVKIRKDAQASKS